MTYAEKLRDPRWQKLRLEVFQRDGFRCQKCGNAEQMLSVHHKLYEWGKEPWDYSIDVLITLCPSCHEEEGLSKNSIRDLHEVLAENGFYNDDIGTLAFALTDVLGTWNKDWLLTLLCKLSMDELFQKDIEDVMVKHTSIIEIDHFDPFPF